MQFSKYIPQFLLVGLLACALHCTAPERNVPSIAGPAFAQVQLTVTLTVVASVGIVFDSHGEPKLMEANSAAHSDNVSTLHPALSSVMQTVLQPQTPETTGKKQ